MKNMKSAFIVVCALFYASVMGISSSMAEEPNPYIRGGSIGVDPDNSPDCPKKKDGFTYRPITCWPGEKFIFLPQSKRLQRYGYQSFEGGKGEFGHPTYEEAMGRVGTVLEVTKRFIGSMRSGWKVTIQMDDNGQHYTGRALFDDPDDATLDDIVPLLDLRAARNKYLGKHLWLKSPDLDTYNEATGEFGRLRVPNISRVTVTDVVAGWFADRPILLIVQTDSGAEGYSSIALSGTNISGALRFPSLLRSLDWKFFERDPRQIFDWSERVWDAIASQRVFVGMEETQARLSWGRPKDINRTNSIGVSNEQWVYGDRRYLYFEGGILRSIQQ